jgi:hypothetical protein
MDDRIESACPDSLRALRLRALALASVAAASIFFLVVGLGAKHFELGDITRIQVLSGVLLFGLGGLLHPNRNGLLISALLWGALQFFVEKELGFGDDSLSLFFGQEVTQGDIPEITAGVFFAAFTFFLIARYHYIAVLDRSLWRDYDRYVLDHPDFFWWRRDAPPRQRAMSRPNAKGRRDAVHGGAFFDGPADPLTIGIGDSHHAYQIAGDDDFWGPRYGSSTLFFDDRPWGLYGEDTFGDDDRGFTS